MSNRKYILVAILVIVIFQAFLVIKFPAFFNMKKDNNPSDRPKTIKYVPIGDSYTIGLGVDEQYRWPNVMVKNLNNNGLDIELVANPAFSGYTVRDAIDYELPVIEELRPDFVTVFIGANDNFAQRSVVEFQDDLVELLDKLQTILEEPENIVLVTIPDYSKTPGVNEKDNDGLSKFIEDYNRVIKELAVKRNLKVADLFTISQTMTEREDYIEDGLHPSPLGYLKWERVIYDTVFNLLKD